MFSYVTIVLQQYRGNGYLLFLYFLALFLLLWKEKEGWKRVVLLAAPICIFAAFMIPLFQKAFVRLLDADTYYRLLWTLPMGITIAYAGVVLFGRFRKLGLVVMAGVVILCGKNVYQSPYMFPAENALHLPQTAVNICEAILPENGDQVCAVFPDELIHYVRQYSSKIIMPYGREMLVAQWDYDNPFYRLMQEGGMETGELSVTAKGYNCNYVILRTNQEFQEPMEDFGYEIVATIDGYHIYKDTTITWPN